MTQPVLRFAPSPNGALHLGHALSALLNQQFAEALGGRLLLRIEDIDPLRCRPDLIPPMLEDLAWLGLTWERPVRRQSEHLADYARALEILRQRGLLHACHASRREVEAAAARAGSGTDPDGAPRHPGSGQVLDASESAARSARGGPPAWRLDMARAIIAAGPPPPIRSFAPDGSITERRPDPALWGDVVLARKDVPTSYHLSVVVDDALQGVTHVVRGRDLERATDLHVLLQCLLGQPTPLYHHHRLLAGADGQKLAKSRGDTALASLRASGTTPQKIMELLCIS
jgi:glutamyl-Q tRNA(Asp) synthetase